MLAVVEGFGAHGSRTGKIHMQKALALVSEAAGVALPFSCVLYRHGPYSFDIAIELPAAPRTRKSATRGRLRALFPAETVLSVHGDHGAVAVWGVSVAGGSSLRLDCSSSMMEPMTSRQSAMLNVAQSSGPN